jgi:hypothetical protein
MRHVFFALPALLLAILPACDDVATLPDLGGDRVTMRLEPHAADFFAMPYPNSLRFDAEARRINLDGFPNPESRTHVDEILRLAAEERGGFSLTPVVTFAFDDAIDASALPTDEDTPPPAQPLAWFVNVSPGHSGYGRRIPALAAWYPEAGAYAPANLLALVPWPGLTLDGDADWAAIVLREVGDEGGRPLGQAAALAAALAGRGDATLAESYAPLAAWLADATDAPAAGAIAAATVFPTGNPAAELKRLVEAVAATTAPTLVQPFEQVHLDEAFCLVRGKLRFPQYQNGVAPYGTGGGVFTFGDDGLPVKQRDEDVPVVLTLPRGVTMPASGFPYLEYVHGSGGVATQLIDRGPKTAEYPEGTPWRGPAYLAATRGLAAGGHAMPISPDRVPDVGDFDYIQLSNLGSVRDSFRQGMIELTLKRRWLAEVTLPTSLCPESTAPGGAFRFNSDRHATMGHSMGAMYANMYAAITSETLADIPTGSGGYWSYFIFTTDLIPGAREILRALFGIPGRETWGPVHPLMGLFQQFVEKVDPIAFAPHVVADPLPGVQAKHLFLMFGREDVYFSDRTQRAMTLAYGAPLAGPEVVPGTLDLLAALTDLQPASLPLTGNLTAADGTKVTAGQTQWQPDLPHEPNGHNVVFQYDALRWAFGCFLADIAAGQTPIYRDGAAVTDVLADCD